MLRNAAKCCEMLRNFLEFFKKHNIYKVFSFKVSPNIVDPVIICTYFEETGNEWFPYYERCSCKGRVYN